MREVQHNGYRGRDRDIRAGRIAPAIPKLRKGSDFPSFIEPRRTAGKALVAVIQEANAHGISMRAVDDLVEAIGACGMSKSQVRRLCAEIDERVNAFPSRPQEGARPYFRLDATCLKVPEGGRIVSRAVIEQLPRTRMASGWCWVWPPALPGPGCSGPNSSAPPPTATCAA